jgi:hypothetical protein
MKREVVRSQVQRVSNFTGGHPLWTGLHKQAKYIEAIFLGQGR